MALRERLVKFQIMVMAPKPFVVTMVQALSFKTVAMVIVALQVQQGRPVSRVIRVTMAIMAMMR